MPPRLLILSGDALVTAIDDLAWKAARKENAIAADPALYPYLPLFTHAVAFWRELTAAANSDQPLTRDQQFALNCVANGTMRGGPQR